MLRHSIQSFRRRESFVDQVGRPPLQICFCELLVQPVPYSVQAGARPAFNGPRARASRGVCAISRGEVSRSLQRVALAAGGRGLGETLGS